LPDLDYNYLKSISLKNNIPTTKFMFYRLLFLFFLLILGHPTMAQDFSWHKGLKEIDRLILYKQLDLAQKKTDSLYQKLNTSKEWKKNRPLWLEIKYRQALLLDEQGSMPTEQLQILLGIIDEVKEKGLHSLSYHIYLLIALSHEKAAPKGNDHRLTKAYLDKAYTVYRENNLEELYSTYCIRRSSYERLVNDWESSYHFATQAEIYAKQYNNTKDLNDAYLLLGNYYYSKNDYESTLKYDFLRLRNIHQHKSDISIASQLNNISKVYLKMKNYSQALNYSDSAYAHYKKLPVTEKHILPKLRSSIYEAAGNTDSAYYYFKQYHIAQQILQKEEDAVKTKKIEEHYQNEKKEATIESKNQQLFFIIVLLSLIIGGAFLLYLKNRKIDKQNKTINRQLVELSKTLEQKQMLLSELQHRVKNNLQHVISILEIQKESVDFNNIDELIRGNQNRIHSMALLHKKLNVSDNVNDVDLKRYITELSELVKESYDNHKKKISLNIKCDVDTISIEKALPLGLIITELVSNSMKHAFKKQNIGIITIEISKNEAGNILYYADNGIGFDFNKVIEKGLGQEIIKGLIDQLSGNVATKNNNGFELTVSFK